MGYLTMVKLTKWEKIELLKIYKQDRKDLRCLIVQDLTKKAKALTSDLIISIAKVKDELHRLEIEQNRILKENKLQDFDSTTDYTCKINTLHQRLILYDRETNTEIQKIIREE